MKSICICDGKFLKSLLGRSCPNTLNSRLKIFLLTSEGFNIKQRAFLTFHTVV